MAGGTSGHFAGTDRFELVAELGSGSMGTVFKVLDRETDSFAALKLLDTRSLDALRRFKHEFRVIQGIQHPNLVTLGELENVDGVWFFTMELVEGADFVSYVRPDGALDERRLRQALVQLARGLQALHESHKIHRDVKPSNIVITDAERLVLLDFGLVHDASSAGSISRTSEIVGTGAYMAPELVGGTLTPASDCYAVGVMLYEALTGDLPFSGPVLEVLARKRDQQAPRPSHACSGLPSDLDDLCVELLQPDPERRPDTREVLRRLGAAEVAAVSDPTGRLFVGRARELAVLMAATREPRTGSTIVVQGTSGVGKTALVRQFQRVVAETVPRALLLWGRCYERESVPFKGIDGVVDALAEFLQSLPADEMAGIVPRNAGVLARVFPVLDRVEAFRERTRVAFDRVGPHELRRRAFAALRELCVEIGRARPVIVLIDDVQWASTDTWTLLEQLTQGAGAPQMQLVLTRRPTTDRIRMLTRATLIELGPLPDDEALDLASSLLSQSGRSDRGSAAALAREAEGHPLFIQQLARHMIEGGEASEGGARLEIALQRRIDRLSLPAQELVRLVAIAGVPTPHTCMARAAALDYRDYLRLVSELQAAHMVRTVGTRPFDTIEHYHDRIRETVLATIHDDRRKRLHLQLANAIEETGVAQRAPQLAVNHLSAAGLSERAAYHAETAAQRAMGVLAFEQAASLYFTALKLGNYSERDVRRLTLLLADALVNAGRGAEAAELYLQAAQTGNAADRLDCQRRAAEQLLLSGHVEDGIRVLSTVLADIGEALPDTPKRALASLLWQRALLRLRGLRWSPRDESEIAPRELVRLDVYQTVATGLTLVDNIRGADYQCRFLRMALRLGEPVRLIRALSFEAALVASTGSRRRSRKLTRQLEQWAKRIDNPEAKAYERLAAAGCAIYLDNDWPATLRAAEEAEHLLRSYAQAGGWETDTARLFKCFALLHLGKLEHLARLIPIYTSEAERRGDLYASVNVRSRLVMPWLAADDPDGAQDDLDEALAAWVPWQRQYLVQHFFALHSLCEIALYRGDAAAADAHVAEQFPSLKSSLLLRLWMPRGEVDHLRGRIAIARAVASPDDRREQLARAHRFARRLDRNILPATDGWARLLRAGAAGAAGDEACAVRLLRDAIDALDRTHNALYANAARAALGRRLAGDDGAEHRERAGAWMEAQGIAAPDRLVALLVPGA